MQQQQQQEYQLQHQYQHQYPSVNPLIMDTDGKWREAQAHVAPPCPRCASANTKFCYYNNYSLAQPRYFCKACRRYWTKGGSLRNVPVGGGCRKSRRSRSRAHRHRPVDSVAPDNSSSSSSSGKSGGPEIDMAAVFARYVSQDVGIVPSQEQGQDLLAPALHDGQAFKDLESFDYEMLVTDDVFWSTTSEDGSTANWEPMAPLEELDSAPLVFDEQFMGSPDLVSDFLVNDANYWSCFDLAGCGDFYRP